MSSTDADAEWVDQTSWVSDYRYSKRIKYEIKSMHKSGWKVRFTSQPGQLLLEHRHTNECVVLNLTDQYPFGAVTTMPTRRLDPWSPNDRLTSLIARPTSARYEP